MNKVIGTSDVVRERAKSMQASRSSGQEIVVGRPMAQAQDARSSARSLDLGHERAAAVA